jgi:hypothetical protein
MHKPVGAKFIFLEERIIAEFLLFNQQQQQQQQQN